MIILILIILAALWLVMGPDEFGDRIVMPVVVIALVVWALSALP